MTSFSYHKKFQFVINYRIAVYKSYLRKLCYILVDSDITKSLQSFFAVIGVIIFYG